MNMSYLYCVRKVCVSAFSLSTIMQVSILFLYILHCDLWFIILVFEQESNNTLKDQKMTLKIVKSLLEPFVVSTIETRCVAMIEIGCKIGG
jgi:hypothetical protein